MNFKKWIQWLSLPLLALGCSGLGNDPQLPESRPANFRIQIFDGGGMLPESEDYFITNDSAGRESFFQQTTNRWTFVPDPAKLDSFYQALRVLNPTGIRAKDGGMVYDRGGVSLQMEFDKHAINVSDAGSSFVVETDQPRFASVFDAVTKFVSDGLSAKMIPVNVFLMVEAPDSIVENCSVYLSQERVVEWARTNAEPLLYEHRLSMLPGNYGLRCWAKVGGKDLSFNQQIQLTPTLHDFQIVLKTDTFEIQQQ